MKIKTEVVANVVRASRRKLSSLPDASIDSMKSSSSSATTTSKTTIKSKATGAAKTGKLAETLSEHLFFATHQQWYDWLDANGSSNPSGVWVKFSKVASGIQCMTWPEAVRVALCHGWIDSLCKRLDDTYRIQRFTPRRPKGNWSLINKNHVTELIAEGRMRESGMKEVNAAKADGRWDKLNYSYEKEKANDDDKTVKLVKKSSKGKDTKVAKKK